MGNYVQISFLISKAMEVTSSSLSWDKLIFFLKQNSKIIVVLLLIDIFCDWRKSVTSFFAAYDALCEEGTATTVCKALDEVADISVSGSVFKYGVLLLSLEFCGASFGFF
jgi:hypothetical protein